MVLLSFQRESRTQLSTVSLVPFVGKVWTCRSSGLNTKVIIYNQGMERSSGFPMHQNLFHCNRENSHTAVKTLSLLDRCDTPEVFHPLELQLPTLLAVYACHNRIPQPSVSLVKVASYNHIFQNIVSHKGRYVILY